MRGIRPVPALGNMRPGMCLNQRVIFTVCTVQRLRSTGERFQLPTCQEVPVMIIIKMLIVIVIIIIIIIEIINIIITTIIVKSYKAQASIGPMQ